MYATEAEVLALIEGDNHTFIAEQNEAGVFKSKTFVLMLDDKQDKKSQLFEAHMNATSTKEQFGSLEVLKGGDRKGRTNVTFCPTVRFDKLAAYFEMQTKIEN